MKIEKNFNLKNHNTFGIDVKCDTFVSFTREVECLDFVQSYEVLPEELLILGGGSNFLFTADIEGVVIYPDVRGLEVVREDEKNILVRVGAGERWDDFVAWAAERGYGGVENLSGIPGHVGATPVQNIGAYGMEAGESIERVEAVDVEHGRLVEIAGADCRFAYRDSMFKHEWKNGFIVTRVLFRLSKHPRLRLDYGSVRQEVERTGVFSPLGVREAILRIRASKLPDVNLLPNAGSFFKNPLVTVAEAEPLRVKYPRMPVYTVDEQRVKLAAGWLIEQSGWKGRQLGHAAVHDKQALVLVNRGGATGIEIARLANEVKKAVFLQFGVVLEPEVNII